MTKAYAYVRFSTKGQIEGDSQNRQLKAAREYAAKHKLILDESYHDLGVSAFKGLNVSDGNLGRFIAAVESGIVPKGSYLLVENLDRISRNKITEAQQLFLRIINLDIVIVTLMDQQVISKERVNSDGGISMMLSLMYMLRAHEESKTKSDRVAKGWSAARSDPDRKIITKMAPAWLEVKNDKFAVIPKMAKVIKRIFKITIEDGFGTPKIANILHNEGVPTFGKAKEWNAALVSHILRNKAVTGVYETKKIDERDGYFPIVISKDDFARAREITTQRKFAPSKRPNSTILNLFAGYSKCGLCGTKMKSVSATQRSAYIQCNKAYQNRGCNATRVAYAEFEKSILDWLVNKEGLDIYGAHQVVKTDPRPLWKMELDEVNAKIATATEYMFSMPNSPALLKGLAALEIQQAEIQQKLNSYIGAKTNVSETIQDVKVFDWIHQRCISAMERGERENLHLLDEDTNFAEWPLRPNPKECLTWDDLYLWVRQKMQFTLRTIINEVRFHPISATVNKQGIVREFYEVEWQLEHENLNGQPAYLRGCYDRKPKGFQKGNKNGKPRKIS